MASATAFKPYRCSLAVRLVTWIGAAAALAGLACLILSARGHTVSIARLLAGLALDRVLDRRRQAGSSPPAAQPEPAVANRRGHSPPGARVAPDLDLDEMARPGLSALRPPLPEVSR